MNIKSLFFLPAFLISLAASGQINGQAEKLKATLSLLESMYVDSIQAEELTENAIRSMLEELDPHSVYIPRKELEDMNEPLVGKFEGIGVQFQILKDTIVVVAAIPGGPSEKLGIQAGDKIVTIEGKNVAGTGVTNSDVTDKLRGEKGTKVKVGIKRRGEREVIHYTITRDNIPLHTIDAKYMARPGVGYIKLNRFAQNTMDEFTAALSELKGKGMQNLILDLRGNGGGYLHTAIGLADEFLGNAKLIVYTEGLHQEKQSAFASSKGTFENGKLVVLIDESSASASEIVAGAVQDWDRGIVIGRRSFGKGLVQKPFTLPDGSVIRLTTARYYTPTGRSIQKPYDDGVEAYHRDLYSRYLHGEYVTADSINLPDSLKYYTPAKRVVYGGGGIMPDIFIPVDTNRASDFYTDINRNNLLSQFVLIYLDKNRSALVKDYPDVESFEKNFKISPELFEKFLVYVEKEGVKRNQEEIQRSRSLIEMQLRGIIARNLWDTSAYFQVTNEESSAYLKALEVLKDRTFEEQKINY